MGKEICKQNPVRWVSIDPGLGGTGLAFWENDRLLVDDEEDAKGVHTIRPPDKDADWMKKALRICDKADGLFESYGPTKVVIEEPFVSLRGRKTLVAAKAGSVVKLSILSGMLIQTAINSMDYHMAIRFFKVELIPPSVWKGQLPDKALKNRIEAWAKKEKCSLPSRLSEHARDALGLGLHYLGKL